MNYTTNQLTKIINLSTFCKVTTISDKDSICKLMKLFGLLIIPIFSQVFLLTSPAQATHNVKNGCGDDTGLGSLVPNNPTGASFQRACNNHDWCYGTLNQSKDYCDRKFHNEMLDQCSKTFHTIITRPLRATCNGVADNYYSAVKNSSNATRAYREAQTHAREEAFRWSQAGPIAGRTCTRIYEDADPNAWSDNYLCADRDFGIQWSQAGAIAGMKCTRIYEDADPYTWSDNYLCLPSSSTINFNWSQAGPISNMTCTRIYEDADPHAWNDNYLCY